MNSTKTNLRLIENITVQVANTASISKDILFHISKFLEKMIFELCLKLLRELAKFTTVGILFRTIRVRYYIYIYIYIVFIYTHIYQEQIGNRFP